MRFKLNLNKSNELNFDPSDLQLFKYQSFEQTRSFPDSVWSQALKDKALALLFGYKIFPPEVLKHTSRWVNPVEPGNIIQQAIFIGPLQWNASVKIHDVDTNSFTYDTLKGHPEAGRAKFSITFDDPTKTIKFRIESWSRPGHWITSVLFPFTSLIQMNYTKSALNHFLKQFS